MLTSVILIDQFWSIASTLTITAIQMEPPMKIKGSNLRNVGESLLIMFCLVQSAGQKSAIIYKHNKLKNKLDFIRNEI